VETVPNVGRASRTGRLARRLDLALPLALLAGALTVVPGCSSDEPPKEAAQEAVAPVGQGFTLNAGDIRFIRQQIRIAENHVAGNPLFGPGPNQIPHALLPYGLRTVSGIYNNVLPGQEGYGAADRVFPRLLTPNFRPAENAPPSFGGVPTSYAQKKGLVFDSHPRLVSNLIVDQSPANPAAQAAWAALADPVFDGSATLFIPNTAPDVGLSAPYNSLFTLFGQFFDHGLDLVTKGGGTVFVPLRADDPLFVPGSPTNFMVLSRATNQPGPDGILGDNPATPQDESADDVQEATNTTTPFVDQNQTYTSHSSHQVFLREYRLDAASRPVATGRLLDGAIPGNIGNWSEVKAQAATMLGIALSDVDVLNVPLLATDDYGRFIRGPSGLPQVVFPGNVLVEGSRTAPISVAGAVKTGHSFLDDIAHHAVPFGDHDNNPGTPPQPLAPDTDPGTADDGNPATYDDELLGAHFITGDGRGNENIGLTAIHSVFHSEHNRLVADINAMVSALPPADLADWNAVNPASGWDYGERLFQAARFVTEMEYQHLVFEEFARKVQPMVNLFSGYHFDIDPAIVAEFAHTVYRFGHSMLTERVERINADGTRNDIALLDAFLNPLSFNAGGPGVTLTAEQAIGSIVRGMSQQVGNELDEFITEALRNRLLGLPLDLATINLTRGRSEGIPSLNAARRQFYAQTADFALAPYASWAEFGLGLRHPESLVNFIAAYGTHPSVTGAPDMASRRAAATAIVAADPTIPDASDFVFSTGTWADLGGPTITGVDDVDFWVGGLAERQAPFGGLLGSTFNHVFETQLEKLQDGDRLYYLSRTAGLNLLVQLEGNSFAELVMRNSDATGLPADAFSRPDLFFNLAFLGTSGAISDDPTTPDVDESTLTDLVRMPNGTIRYTGVLHVVFNGTDDPNVVDRMWGSEGDDTFRGNGGRDIIEGGSGNDNFIGGEGDDIITDAFGDDVLKGGNGHDALSSGSGFGGDLNMGGYGDDFIVGGNDFCESFGGPGDDVIFAGDSTDTIFGDDGDDWIEGGGQADLLQGDNGAPFFNDLNAPGADVVIGDGGDDDYDMEGNDDIGVTGGGVEKIIGSLGFDWVTYRYDPLPANADLNIDVFAAPDLDVVARDKFKEVEGLSGWRLDDVLDGSSVPDAATMVGHELTQAGIDRIQGLSLLLRGATSFTGGDIIIGGAGSDVIQGREGDDRIDGDAWLNVQLRAPNPNTADPADFQLVDSLNQLRADVFAGRINPGEIDIVRFIVTGDSAPTDVDTAVYQGAQAEYLISINPDGSVVVDHQGGIDGVDTLTNVELLQFTDGTISAPTNRPATGTVLVSDTTPTENQLLTATTAGIADPDGINAATLAFSFEAETAPNVFTQVATGASFSPGDNVVGLRIRAVVTFQDLAVPPATQSIASAPTAAVLAVNDPPTGTPVLSDTTPQVGAPLSAVTAGIADADGLGPFTFQWRANGVNIAGATAVSFTPTAARVGQVLTVVVSWVDQQGFAQSLTSAASAPVAAASGPIASVAGTFNFGIRRVNNPQVGTLTVTNPGTAPLVVSSVTSSGAPFVNPTRGTCTVPINPGGSCRVTVTFLATVPGTFTGSLTIVSNATNSPTLVTLTGTGR
jgi:Ca2+-binding RTX toxin-like protein